MTHQEFVYQNPKEKESNHDRIICFIEILTLELLRNQLESVPSSASLKEVLRSLSLFLFEIKSLILLLETGLIVVVLVLVGSFVGIFIFLV